MYIYTHDCVLPIIPLDRSFFPFAFALLPLFENATPFHRYITTESRFFQRKLGANISTGIRPGYIQGRNLSGRGIVDNSEAHN